MIKPIASALAIKPHLSVFDDLAETRLGALEISNILVAMMSTVPTAVLPNLAWQYHVEGDEGWNQANTDAKRRETLRNAIELHRLKGTPWSVKEALRNIGISNVEFIEGGSRYLDGTWVIDGSWKLGVNNWAAFQVNIYYTPNAGGSGSAETLPNGEPDAATKDRIIKIINEYKPARCVLSGVNYLPLVLHIAIATNTTTIRCRQGELTRVKWTISGDSNVQWAILTSNDGGNEWKKQITGPGSAPSPWSFEVTGTTPPIETIMGRAGIGSYSTDISIEMDLTLLGVGLKNTFIRLEAANATMSINSEHEIDVTAGILTLDSTSITTDNGFINTNNPFTKPVLFTETTLITTDNNFINANTQ